jgi:enoyl-CoA hydratase/carnithine racemase
MIRPGSPVCSASILQQGADLVGYEVIGPRAVITLDDLEHHNPMSNEVMAELAEAVRAAAQDPDVRVLVITGAGDKAFSAGGDLRSGFMDDAAATHRERGALVDLIRALRGCGKPTIARVNGHAFGGGFGLAAACDIAIAADTAMLGTPEVRIGLWPMMITAVLKPLVPQKALFEMFATGRRITAAEAGQLGVVSRVVAADELDAAIDETVAALLESSPATLALGKEAFYAVADMDLDTALDYLHTGLTALGMTDDAKEGIEAFGERRAPEWKGR